MRAEFWHNVVTPAAKAENQGVSSGLQERQQRGLGKDLEISKISPVQEHQFQLSEEKEPAHSVTGSSQLWHLHY